MDDGRGNEKGTSNEIHRESEKVDLESPVTQKVLDKAKVEREKAEEYLVRLQYLQAEFDNYRKRVDRERFEMVQAGVDKLLRDMLDVIDELELAVTVAKNTDDKEVVVNGVQMVLKKLHILLDKEGLTSIDAIGEDYNPVFHEVIQQVPVDDTLDGKIVEEVRKGYILRGKVIRASMVKVGVSAKKLKNNNSEVLDKNE